MWRTGVVNLMLLILVLSSNVNASDKKTSLQTLPASDLQKLFARHETMRQELGNPRYAALVNYRQPSWERRFYLIDMRRKEIVASYRVAHGKGTDPNHDGYADHFSDRHDSHMSSLGFYRTAEVYKSPQANHGMSLKLQGLSSTNSNAMQRHIVIHANDYMEMDFIDRYGMPGRSYGCMTLSSADRDTVITHLKGGALIYAAHGRSVGPETDIDDTGPVFHHRLSRYTDDR